MSSMPKKQKIENTIVVVGADHHNTLAVVRCLGYNKCKIDIVIHGDHASIKNVRVSHSRYAKGKTETVGESEALLLEHLLQKGEAFFTERKAILFPCSDFAAYVMDSNFMQLSRYYMIPGFKDTPGKVVYLMDKWHQKELADQYEIPMAKTWKLERVDSSFEIPQDVIFPCIVKPEISAHGKKSDITICHTVLELQEALDDLKAKGYSFLILQQFLKKQYEVCAYGCLLKNNVFPIGGAIRKLREVTGGGSTTFAKFIFDAPIIELRDRVLQILSDQGYCGQYDIELFVCEDGVYLNEINFRHSGNGYALVSNGIHAPYIGCLDLVDMDIPLETKKQILRPKYHIDELSDLRQVKDHYIGFGVWIRSFMKASAHSVWSWRDMQGAYAFYKAYFNAYFKAAVRKIFKKDR